MRVSTGYGALQIRLRGLAPWSAIETWLGSECHQQPLLAPVGLGAGVALWFGLPWHDQRVAAAIVAVAVAVAGLALRGLAARLLLWGGVLILLGLALAEWRSASVAAPVLGDRFTGDIAGVVEES